MAFEVSVTLKIYVCTERWWDFAFLYFCFGEEEGEEAFMFIIFSWGSIPSKRLGISHRYIYSSRSFLYSVFIY